MEGKHCFTLFGGVTNFYQAILRVGEGHYFEKKIGSLAHSMYWSLSYLIRVDSMTKHGRQKINLCKGGISLKSRDMGGIDYAVRNWGAIECRKGGMVINTQKWGVTHLRMKAA